MTDGPKSVGIIMDGNRRYAKSKNISIFEGHIHGLEKLKEVVEWSREAGIDELTVYAFSNENWNRPQNEIEDLMTVFGKAFDEYFDELIERGGRVRFIGEWERMPKTLQKRMHDTQKKSAHGTGGTLIIALSYGGRTEILSAVNALLTEGRQNITEEELHEKMWSAGMADPDLIIRTSGEKRLSGFLTWQSVYSELFFIDSYWPAFTREEFDAVITEYRARARRHGK